MSVEVRLEFGPSPGEVARLELLRVRQVHGGPGLHRHVAVRHGALEGEYRGETVHVRRVGGGRLVGEEAQMVVTVHGLRRASRVDHVDLGRHLVAGTQPGRGDEGDHVVRVVVGERLRVVERGLLQRVPHPVVGARCGEVVAAWSRPRPAAGRSGRRTRPWSGPPPRCPRRRRGSPRCRDRRRGHGPVRPARCGGPPARAGRRRRAVRSARRPRPAGRRRRQWTARPGRGRRPGRSPAPTARRPPRGSVRKAMRTWSRPFGSRSDAGDVILVRTNPSHHHQEPIKNPSGAVAWGTPSRSAKSHVRPG